MSFYLFTTNYSTLPKLYKWAFKNTTSPAWNSTIQRGCVSEEGTALDVEILCALYFVVNLSQNTYHESEAFRLDPIVLLHLINTLLLYKLQLKSCSVGVFTLTWISQFMTNCTGWSIITVYRVFNSLIMYHDDNDFVGSVPLYPSHIYRYTHKERDVLMFDFVKFVIICGRRWERR